MMKKTGWARKLEMAMQPKRREQIRSAMCSRIAREERSSAPKAPQKKDSVGTADEGGR